MVYHSNYIVWFEVGRVEMLRQIGFNYREMEKEDDTHIVVVDARCRYKMPAHYDDVIRVRTCLLNVRESLLRFGYEIVRDSDQALLAEGETVHLVVGADMKRTPLPENIWGHFCGPREGPMPRSHRDHRGIARFSVAPVYSVVKTVRIFL